MSDNFWTAFFTALPPTIAALGAVLMSWFNNRKAHETSRKIDQDIQATHTAQVKIDQTRTKVEQIDYKVDLAAEQATQAKEKAEEATKKIDAVASKVEDVKKAMNGNNH